jgi:GT2 family glycosyltransferase
MPPKTPRLKFARHSVTTVLVCHDGARWLPTSLAALAAQTRPPQRVVAVDASSRDDSLHLLAESLGSTAVLTAPRSASMGEAVQLGLDAFAGAPAPPEVVSSRAQEWVWVLHDDCAPAANALDRMLARAEESPSASVIGPKVTSWDGRRLVEVGLTIDSAGHRETGLEPRELDQGQHDDVGDVLAVGTAGMLVRREVWDRLGGLDPSWPMFGDDIDFGWRVNSSGGRVIVAPAAVVRHAAAVENGDRDADAVPGRPSVARRRNGMQVVLANTAPLLVPLYVLRFVVESLLRAIATLLLLRRPAGALDELFAMVGVLRAPITIARARRRRRPLRERSHRELRHLLAPPGLRVRHFGDAIAAAFAGRAVAEGRSRRRAPVETGPVAEEAESFDVDDLGIINQLLRKPGVILFLAAIVVALVASRSVLSSTLHGGRLLAAPAGASDLWRTYVDAWHSVGVGSTAVAPPWLAQMSLLSTILGGKPWLAVDVVLIGAIPLAAITAYGAAGILTRNTATRVWVSVLYALTPAMTAAIAGGRIDVVAAVILLPLAARAIASALRESPRRVGWHRCVGAGLLLAFVVGFVPVTWLIAVPAVVVGAVVAARLATNDTRHKVRDHVLGALVVLGVTPLVLLPWTADVVRHPALLVTGAGLAEPNHATHATSVWHLLAFHPGGGAAPIWWSWFPLLLVALVAVGFSSRLTTAACGFVIAASGLAAAVAISKLSAHTSLGATRYWTGAALAVAALGALTAFIVVIDRLPDALRNRAFGWRQPASAALVISLVAMSLYSVGHWLVRGADDPLSGSAASPLPVFAAAEASAPTSPKVLVLRSDADVVHYALLRRATGLSLGDADVAATATGDEVTATARHGEAALSGAVRNLVAGQDAGGPQLAQLGVSLVVVPADSSGALSRLSGVSSLARVPASESVVFRDTIPTGELIMLQPSDAALVQSGRSLRPTARPVPLASAPGRAHVQLTAGPSGRLLVLAEPKSGEWHATVDGHRLQSASAYGWAQAWTLPASGGTLVVSHAAGARPALLLVQLVAVIVVLLLSLPSRRFGRRPSDEDGQ